jgi:biotin--protein ligase
MTIYIYNGPGTSLQSVQHTEYTLYLLVGKHHQIQKIGPDEVCSGIWMMQACLFIMPGGADTLYNQYLSPMGNAYIEHFVRTGGAYLGLCAGAYYGSKNIEFAVGSEIAVVTDRELAFFPGKAIGPILAPYDYRSESGARAASIQWGQVDGFFPIEMCFLVYYNGGCYFENANQYHSITVLAYYHTYDLLQKSAIIEAKVGQGKAILSGVHCEYDPKLLNSQNLFLGPIKEKLEVGNEARMALMAHLLHRLGVHIKCGL